MNTSMIQVLGVFNAIERGTYAHTFHAAYRDDRLEDSVVSDSGEL